jgi:hypothetical protein
MVLFFIFCFFRAGILNTQTPLTAFKPDIAPYVDFLNTQSEKPADYALRQYDHSDIVVLFERDHRDLMLGECSGNILTTSEP